MTEADDYEALSDPHQSPPIYPVLISQPDVKPCYTITNEVLDIHPTRFNLLLRPQRCHEPGYTQPKANPQPNVTPYPVPQPTPEPVPEPPLPTPEPVPQPHDQGSDWSIPEEDLSEGPSPNTANFNLSKVRFQPYCITCGYFDTHTDTNPTDNPDRQTDIDQFSLLRFTPLVIGISLGVIGVLVFFCCFKLWSRLNRRNKHTLQEESMEDSKIQDSTRPVTHPNGDQDQPSVEIEQISGCDDQQSETDAELKIPFPQRQELGNLQLQEQSGSQ